MPRVTPNRSRESESTLARRIERERTQQGLSYEALARRMKDAGYPIASSAIFKIEKGDPPRKISVDELVGFSSVFDVPIEDMLTPIELLDQQRAHELLREIGEAEVRFIEAVTEIVGGYSEYFQLAAHEPDLFEYVHNLRFSDAGPYAATLPEDAEETTRSADKAAQHLFTIEGLPDYDDSAFREAFKSFYDRMIDEGSQVASTILGVPTTEANNGQ